MRCFRKELNKRLENPEYRKKFEREKKRLDLAIKIAEAREKQGLTQGQLAKMANTTQQQISRLETGYNSGIETFITVLDALGIDLTLTNKRKTKEAI